MSGPEEEASIEAKDGENCQFLATAIGQYSSEQQQVSLTCGEHGGVRSLHGRLSPQRALPVDTPKRDS